MADLMELDLETVAQEDTETSSTQDSDTGDTSPESDTAIAPALTDTSLSAITPTGSLLFPRGTNRVLDELSTKAAFLADRSNYIPLGSLICQWIGHPTEEAYTEGFQEVECLPTAIAPMSTQKQIQSLVRKHWIKIFVRIQDDSTIHTRVYALPDDVGRKYVERVENSLRPTLVELIRFLDNSSATWNGRKSDNVARYELGSKSSDSLFYIFNRLPSPNTDGLAVSCPYSNDAIQAVFEPHGLHGLKTPLYPYQKRTVATMIRREAEPRRALDPRLQTLTGPTGTAFYLDVETGILLRDKREYDEACGGILGESMGLGKTLICLAAILATKGHWPSIPPEYSLDRRPIRPRVASLMHTAAAAVAQARIPWKPFFQEMSVSGEDLMNCRTLLEENIPSYDIPIAASSRNTRRPSIYPKSKTIRLCSATLVIAPQNLLSQWNAEISHHIVAGELKVLCLDTSSAAPMPPAGELQSYDIILMSRQRLEREMVPALNTKPASDEKGSCSLGEGWHWHVSDCQSPLRDMHFLRVIMDEGHEFSSYGSRNQTYWALQQLHVQRKWIVSGTPTSGLIGVEVGAAASETSDQAAADSHETNAKILECRRKDSALSQERRDLEKLGGLVVGFLKLQPWANSKGMDQATWSKYIMSPQDGKRKPISLQTLLQSLVVRHRIEDIEADLQLPPLYNRVVYLEPSWYDKLSVNLFALALIVNFVTSERVDEDYMFHAKNRRFLHSLITNLRQANFYWTSWTPEQVQKTINASRTYLEDHSMSGSSCSANDRQLLEQAISLGELILDCKPWQALAQVHEMGIFVEDFPQEAQPAWTLTEREAKESLLSGATQMIKAQEWVDARLHMEDVTQALTGIGNKTMRKLWSQEEEVTGNRSLVQDPTSPLGRRERVAALPGVPKLTQKQTVSRVKAAASPKKSKAAHSALPVDSQDDVSAGLQSDLKVDAESSMVPTLSPDSPLASAKIIGTASTKLSYLMDQLARLHTTEKILVFYEGDHIAYYIAQALELLSIRHLIYTGTLSAARQSAYVTTFNTTPTFRILLMDVHQAAHGLHIASASRVFFVNPVWQPNVEAQAIKRAHRIGQTKPVYVETLVLKDTLEDQMLQRRKGMTAQEHQKAERSLLDDDTMSTIIKNATFIPLQEEEIHNPHAQIAKLHTPQQLFGRPDRPVGDTGDQDADLIFPEGTPKKPSRKNGKGSKKRMAKSEHAPELSASPRTPRRRGEAAGRVSEASSRRHAMVSSMADGSASVGHAGVSGRPSVPEPPGNNGLVTTTLADRGDEVENAGAPSGLFGGSSSLPSGR